MERQTIGERYTVEARIGQGGMAEVFRGFDPQLDRTVAIKVLGHPFDRDAGFVTRFRREAQAAARLNHPNIVAVYDAGADGDTQYIVMEYIEGRTLASFGNDLRSAINQPFFFVDFKPSLRLDIHSISIWGFTHDKLTHLRFSPFATFTSFYPFGVLPLSEC